jgi:hypothetical protein
MKPILMKIKAFHMQFFQDHDLLFPYYPDNVVTEYWIKADRQINCDIHWKAINQINAPMNELFYPILSCITECLRQRMEP